MVHAV